MFTVRPLVTFRSDEGLVLVFDMLMAFVIAIDDLERTITNPLIIVSLDWNMPMLMITLIVLAGIRNEEHVLKKQQEHIDATLQRLEK